MLLPGGWRIEQPEAPASGSDRHSRHHERYKKKQDSSSRRKSSGGAQRGLFGKAVAVVAAAAAAGACASSMSARKATERNPVSNEVSTLLHDRFVLARY